ncbi:MAG: ATP-binding protein [Flavobacteriales bacterium]|nr:ATP-binding protein [Flavobacteriales bacterium]
MELEFKSKLVDTNQSLTLLNSVTTFIGQNGCGKSSILEAIFKKYIEDDTYKVICFSSGQNELFTSLFNEHKRTNRRYLRERNETIDSFYFNSNWVRMLVFCSTVFKQDGLVRKYLVEKNYIQTDSINDDISSRLDFRFRLRKHYVTLIREELEREELGETPEEGDEGYELEENQLRVTQLHETLEKIVSAFNIDFDFRNNENLVKRWLTFDVNKGYQVFTHKDINKVFSFWALATNGWLSNSDLTDCRLKFDNGLEFKNLSDGEYQLLSIYAILDLFDTESTIFLFDEIDSHLYYQNIEKLWTVLKNTAGKVITTTHISDSILQNEIESIKLINNGEIEDDLTIIELSKRLSSIVGQEKYEYKIASRIKHIALLDDHVDWLIFKKLCVKKLGDTALTILNQIIPIKRSSSFETTNEIFGKGKLLFIEELKNQNQNQSFVTKNIFMICDKDDLPNTQISLDLTVQIHREFDAVKKFNSNRTKSHLLSWNRREIENYLLSPTMLNSKGKLSELRAKYPHLNINTGETLDNMVDIKGSNSKDLLHPLYKDGGFDESKLDEIINLIPTNEISEDIERMHKYLESNI